MESELPVYHVRNVPAKAIDHLRQEALDAGYSNTAAGVIRFAVIEYARFRGWDWREPVERDTTDGQYRRRGPGK